MQKESQTPKTSEPINAIRVIHFAILMGALIFGGLVFVLINASSTLTDSENLLIYVPIISALIALPASIKLFNNKIQDGIAPGVELKNKLMTFQSAHIIRIALLEAVALLSVITCLLTNTSVNFITFLLIIFYLVLLFPTSSRVAEHLHLSNSERIQLESD
ncbi:hypothetical protein [Ekhidna sp.]|uniref:hypothetical protein n=1 Tax=Ekhidna sp. TaxID=2608089 RepID=UPI003C7A245B